MVCKENTGNYENLMRYGGTSVIKDVSLNINTNGSSWYHAYPSNSIDTHIYKIYGYTHILDKEEHVDDKPNKTNHMYHALSYHY